jgi:hypothetical protein
MTLRDVYAIGLPRGIHQLLEDTRGVAGKATGALLMCAAAVVAGNKVIDDGRRTSTAGDELTGNAGCEALRAAGLASDACPELLAEGTRGVARSEIDFMWNVCSRPQNRRTWVPRLNRCCYVYCPLSVPGATPSWDDCTGLDGGSVRGGSCVPAAPRPRPRAGRSRNAERIRDRFPGLGDCQNIESTRDHDTAEEWAASGSPVAHDQNLAVGSIYYRCAD